MKSISGKYFSDRRGSRTYLRDGSLIVLAFFPKQVGNFASNPPSFYDDDGADQEGELQKWTSKRT